MEFLKYFLDTSTVLGVVGTVLTTIFAFLATRVEQQRPPKAIAWGALAASVLVIIASVFSGFEESQREQQMTSKTEEIARLTEKLSKMNERIANVLTGADSFCYYQPGFARPNGLLLMLIPVGAYPIREVSIRIVDGNKLDEVVQKHGVPVPMDAMRSAETRVYRSIFFGEGQANVGDVQQHLELPVDRDVQSYSIFFTAMNGEWHQQISLRRIGGNWKLASRVRSMYSNELLMPEWVMGDYPRNERNEVEW